MGQMKVLIEVLQLASRLNLKYLRRFIFSLFFTTFCFPWRRTWGNHAKCCMDGKRIRCLQIVSLHVTSLFLIRVHTVVSFYERQLVRKTDTNWLTMVAVTCLLQRPQYDRFLVKTYTVNDIKNVIILIKSQWLLNWERATDWGQCLPQVVGGRRVQLMFLHIHLYTQTDGIHIYLYTPDR